MKKAKIMLIAIAVFAVVGGALAFKANTKFLEVYCIKTTLNNSDKFCNAQTVFTRPAEIGETGLTYYYTTQKAAGGHVVVLADCPAETPCPSISLTNE
jgi:hypothetical protein